nr:hypothetical protein [Tanacetum cinerariifolium]
MAKLLRAPTEGYAEAIVIPPILAEHFELKHSLINMMTSDQFFRLEKDNPHDHIRAARRWLEKEPPRSILTWEYLVSKFINKLFPPLRTTNLRNEIFNFQQRFDESFHEALDRYKDLLRACPHHGFIELHQLDTFYNALNPTDQESLNSTAGGNLLERRTQDVLTIIENKSKDRNSRNKSIVSQVKSSDAILKQFQATPPPAFVKNIEEIYVTYGGARPYYQCLAADGNTFLEFWDNIQGNISAAAINYNQASMSNQTNELKNMMASFFQMNTASTSGSEPLPSKTIANQKGELKSITTRSGIVLDGPSVPMPPLFINPKEDERVEETLMDPELGEFTIKVPPPLVQKPKPPSQRNYVKEKLLELENTPLNENCSAIILKKLPEKLRDPGKFLIPCGFSELKCKALADLGDIALIKKLLNLDSTKDLPPPHNINPLSGSTTSSSPDHLLEEFADELARITFLPGNDHLSFAIEFDLKEIEYLLNHDPTKEMDYILEDSLDESNLADTNVNLFDTMPKMFTDEHTLDYSSPPLYDEYDDDLDEFKSSDFLPSLEYDSFLFEDFSEVDALPSTNNEDKVFNPGILIQENLFEDTIQAIPDKNVKKIAISHASLILEDFDPPLYELPFHKEVPGSKTLLLFSFKNEEKVFKPEILTYKGVHSSLLPELSHRGPETFKVIKILESPVKIFPYSHGEDIRILDVPCLHFYPS